MNKKILAALCLSVIIAGSIAIGAYAASDIKLLINGKPISADIQIVDGSSYVPLRVVSESLGAEVKWDGDSRTISITQNGGTPAVVSKAPLKSFDVNVNVASGPMTLNISKVTFDPAYKKDDYSKAINAVVLDAVVENTSSDKVNWFTTQGKIVLNTKEQANSALMQSDSVGGEFLGKVVKKGRIVFEVKSNLTDITSISYFVSGPSNDKLTRLGEDKTTEIILK